MNEPEKTVTVELTVEQWASVLFGAMFTLIYNRQYMNGVDLSGLKTSMTNMREQFEKHGVAEEIAAVCDQRKEAYDNAQQN